MEEKPRNALEEILVSLLKLIWEMVVAVFSVIPLILKFISWVLLAIVVLPCVWVAGSIYPLWIELGEDF